MRTRTLNLVTAVVYILILTAAAGTSFRRVTAHHVADETVRLTPIPFQNR